MSLSASPSIRALRALALFAFALLFLSLPSLPAPGQTVHLTGSVSSPDGAPVPGATVTIGAHSAVTAADGRFELPAAKLPAQLDIRGPGFANETVQVSTNPIHVTIHPAPLAETVTVVATARNESVTDVPILTSVMGAQRVQTAAAVNLDSVLREFSSLATLRRSTSLTAHPTTQGVSLLGTGASGASRALVLLDGLPLNDLYGGWVDWLRVPDEAVDQISVAEGGVSSLYGNDALSGTVDIATRVPSASQLSLRTGGGELGTRFADGVASAGVRSIYGDVAFRSLGVDGYVPVAPSVAGPVDTKAGVVANDAAPQIQWLPSARAMFVAAGEYFGESRRNGTPLQQNSTALRQLSLRASVQGLGFWRGSAFTQSETFASSFSNIAANRSSETLVLDQHVPSRANGAGVDWSAGRGTALFLAGASVTHISAVDLEFAPLAATNRLRSNDGRQNLAGGFAQLEWQPMRAVSVLARIREDRWRNYDAFQAQASGVTGYSALTRTAASPSLGFTWKALSPLSLHASVYEAFRAPSLNELYRPFRLGNVMTLANPALTAERFRGFQAGADVTLSTSALLRATYFDGRVANSISTVTLSSTPTLITRQRQNLGRVRPRGEEFSAKVRATTWLTLWTDYTHLHSAVESAATASLVGKVVALVPSNNASARAIADWRRWNISLTERFGGAQFEDDLNTAVLPAFWTTDVFVSRDMAGDWLHGVHMLSPYVAVENLWNRRYAVAWTPTPTLNSPRAVTAGVRLQLGRD